MTPETISDAKTICALLGGGDPRVSYTKLMHNVLAMDQDLSTRAAAASLGFSSDGDTHLKRLDDFGQQVHLDQRQVRRYSDRGIRAIAKLIATNWINETVPTLTTHVIASPQGWEVMVMTRAFYVVRMLTPQINLYADYEEEILQPEWIGTEADLIDLAHLKTPLQIGNVASMISLAIEWRGEVWPKFDVYWGKTDQPVASESVGNTVMLRLKHSER